MFMGEKTLNLKYVDKPVDTAREAIFRKLIKKASFSGVWNNFLTFCNLTLMYSDLLLDSPMQTF